MPRLRGARDPYAPYARRGFTAGTNSMCGGTSFGPSAQASPRSEASGRASRDVKCIPPARARRVGQSSPLLKTSKRPRPRSVAPPGLSELRMSTRALPRCRSSVRWGQSDVARRCVVQLLQSRRLMSATSARRRRGRSWPRGCMQRTSRSGCCGASRCAAPIRRAARCASTDGRGPAAALRWSSGRTG